MENIASKFSHRVELSDNDILARAPAAFQEASWHGVSPRYIHVSSKEVVTSMRREGWVPFNAVQQRVTVNSDRSGFQKHQISFRRAGQQAVKGEYIPEISITNSHDGRSSYFVAGALWRCICANGLIVSPQTLEEVRFRHSNVKAEDILTATAMLYTQMPRISDKVEAMKGKELTTEAAHEFAKRALHLRFEVADEAPIRSETLLYARRSEDLGFDLWRTFNRVQENLVQGCAADPGRGVRPSGRAYGSLRALRAIDSRVTVNQELWELAETYLN